MTTFTLPHADTHSRIRTLAARSRAHGAALMLLAGSSIRAAQDMDDAGPAAQARIARRFAAELDV